MRAAILVLLLAAACSSGGADGPPRGAFRIEPQALCYNAVSVWDMMLGLPVETFEPVYICGYLGETFQTPPMFAPGLYRVTAWGSDSGVPHYDEVVTLDGPLVVIKPP